MKTDCASQTSSAARTWRWSPSWAKVQIMRDGNVYITERPKRTRNQALFRDDNCSLSLGQNGKFYFVFSLPSEQLDELPGQLVRQASVIAGKVIHKLM